MLCLRTRDNWAFEVDFTVPSGGDTDTYTNAATDNSAIEAITAFLVWANDPVARSWGIGTYTFAATVYPDEGGWSYTITVTEVASGLAADFDVAPDALTTARMNWILDAGTFALVPEGRASGTWLPSGQPSPRLYLRHLRGDGNGSGTGVCRNGVAGLACRYPTADAIATHLESADLVFLLADAATPRQCWIYEVAPAVWRLLSLGKVGIARADPLLSRVALEVVG